MPQSSQNSYLKKYQMKKQNTHSLSPVITHDHSVSPQSITSLLKLQNRINGLQIKVSSVVNVVKLLQKYTESRDDQYEKQKQNQILKQTGIIQNKPQIYYQNQYKQFESMIRNMKQQIKKVQKLKNNLVLNQIPNNKTSFSYNLQQMQTRLRQQLNKKIQVCIKLINNKQNDKGITQKINQINFNLNQLQNDCKRNRMMFQKDIDSLTNLIKIRHNNSNLDITAYKNHHNISPNKSHQKSKSKSQRSLSKGKQNKSGATLVLNSKNRQIQLKQALRKKKQYRQRVKVGY